MMARPRSRLPWWLLVISSTKRFSKMSRFMRFLGCHARRAAVMQ
jgi:hypothetical protein